MHDDSSVILFCPCQRPGESSLCLPVRTQLPNPLQLSGPYDPTSAGHATRSASHVAGSWVVARHCPAHTPGWPLSTSERSSAVAPWSMPAGWCQPPTASTASMYWINHSMYCSYDKSALFLPVVLNVLLQLLVCIVALPLLLVCTASITAMYCFNRWYSMYCIIF